MSKRQSQRFDSFLGQVFNIWFRDDIGRRVPARVYLTGCGFAYSMVVTTYDGEDIYTMTTTGGHSFHGHVTVASANCPITFITTGDDGECVRRFKASLPKGLADAIGKHRQLKSQLIPETT